MQAKGGKEWVLPEGFCLEFDALRGELMVGGVYVRLFMKKPQFPLRNPKVRSSSEAAAPACFPFPCTFFRYNISHCSF